MFGLMVKGIKNGVDLINDVSGFKYDKNSLNVVKSLNHYIEKEYLENPILNFCTFLYSFLSFCNCKLV